MPPRIRASRYRIVDSNSLSLVQPSARDGTVARYPDDLNDPGAGKTSVLETAQWIDPGSTCHRNRRPAFYSGAAVASSSTAQLPLSHDGTAGARLILRWIDRSDRSLTVAPAGVNPQIRLHNGALDLLHAAMAMINARTATPELNAQGTARRR